jgi:hypothetical protein
MFMPLAIVQSRRGHSRRELSNASLATVLVQGRAGGRRCPYREDTKGALQQCYLAFMVGEIDG